MGSADSPHRLPPPEEAAAALSPPPSPSTPFMGCGGLQAGSVVAVQYYTIADDTWQWGLASVLAPPSAGVIAVAFWRRHRRRRSRDGRHTRREGKAASAASVRKRTADRTGPARGSTSPMAAKEEHEEDFCFPMPASLPMQEEKMAGNPSAGEGTSPLPQDAAVSSVGTKVDAVAFLALLARLWRGHEKEGKASSGSLSLEGKPPHGMEGVLSERRRRRSSRTGSTAGSREAQTTRESAREGSGRGTPEARQRAATPVASGRPTAPPLLPHTLLSSAASSRHHTSAPCGHQEKDHPTAPLLPASTSVSMLCGHLVSITPSFALKAVVTERQAHAWRHPMQSSLLLPASPAKENSGAPEGPTLASPSPAVPATDGLGWSAIRETQLALFYHLSRLAEWERRRQWVQAEVERHRLEAEGHFQVAQEGLWSAREEVRHIDLQHLVEIQSYRTPPQVVQYVMSLVLIVLGEEGELPCRTDMKGGGGGGGPTRRPSSPWGRRGGMNDASFSASSPNPLHAGEGGPTAHSSRSSSSVSSHGIVAADAAAPLLRSGLSPWTTSTVREGSPLSHPKKPKDHHLPSPSPSLPMILPWHTITTVMRRPNFLSSLAKEEMPPMSESTRQRLSMMLASHAETFSYKEASHASVPVGYMYNWVRKQMEYTHAERALYHFQHTAAFRFLTQQKEAEEAMERETRCLASLVAQLEQRGAALFPRGRTPVKKTTPSGEPSNVPLSPPPLSGAPSSSSSSSCWYRITETTALLPTTDAGGKGTAESPVVRPTATVTPMAVAAAFPLFSCASLSLSLPEAAPPRRRRAAATVPPRPLQACPDFSTEKAEGVTTPDEAIFCRCVVGVVHVSDVLYVVPETMVTSTTDKGRRTERVDLSGEAVRAIHSAFPQAENERESEEEERSVSCSDAFWSSSFFSDASSSAPSTPSCEKAPFCSSVNHNDQLPTPTPWNGAEEEHDAVDHGTHQDTEEREVPPGSPPNKKEKEEEAPPRPLAVPSPFCLLPLHEALQRSRLLAEEAEGMCQTLLVAYGTLLRASTTKKEKEEEKRDVGTEAGSDGMWTSPPSVPLPTSTPRRPPTPSASGAVPSGEGLPPPLWGSLSDPPPNSDMADDPQRPQNATKWTSSSVFSLQTPPSLVGQEATTPTAILFPPRTVGPSSSSLSLWGGTTTTTTISSSSGGILLSSVGPTETIHSSEGEKKSTIPSSGSRWSDASGGPLFCSRPHVLPVVMEPPSSGIEEEEEDLIGSSPPHSTAAAAAVWELAERERTALEAHEADLRHLLQQSCRDLGRSTQRRLSRTRSSAGSTTQGPTPPEVPPPHHHEEEEAEEVPEGWRALAIVLEASESLAKRCVAEQQKGIQEALQQEQQWLWGSFLSPFSTIGKTEADDASEVEEEAARSPSLSSSASSLEKATTTNNDGGFPRHDPPHFPAHLWSLFSIPMAPIPPIPPPAALPPPSTAAVVRTTLMAHCHALQQQRHALRAAFTLFQTHAPPDTPWPFPPSDAHRTPHEDPLPFCSGEAASSPTSPTSVASVVHDCLVLLARIQTANQKCLRWMKQVDTMQRMVDTGHPSLLPPPPVVQEEEEECPSHRRPLVGDGPSVAAPLPHTTCPYCVELLQMTAAMRRLEQRWELAVRQVEVAIAPPPPPMMDHDDGHSKTTSCRVASLLRTMQEEREDVQHHQHPPNLLLPPRTWSVFRTDPEPSKAAPPPRSADGDPPPSFSSSLVASEGPLASFSRRPSPTQRPPRRARRPHTLSPRPPSPLFFSPLSAASSVELLSPRAASSLDASGRPVTEEEEEEERRVRRDRSPFLSLPPTGPSPPAPSSLWSFLPSLEGSASKRGESVHSVDNHTEEKETDKDRSKASLGMGERRPLLCVCPSHRRHPNRLGLESMLAGCGAPAAHDGAMPYHDDPTTTTHTEGRKDTTWVVGSIEGGDPPPPPPLPDEETKREEDEASFLFFPATTTTSAPLPFPSCDRSVSVSSSSLLLPAVPSPTASQVAAWGWPDWEADAALVLSALWRLLSEGRAEREDQRKAGHGKGGHHHPTTAASHASREAISLRSWKETDPAVEGETRDGGGGDRAARQEASCPGDPLPTSMGKEAAPPPNATHETESTAHETIASPVPMRQWEEDNREGRRTPAMVHALQEENALLRQFLYGHPPGAEETEEAASRASPSPCESRMASIGTLLQASPSRPSPPPTALPDGVSLSTTVGLRPTPSHHSEEDRQSPLPAMPLPPPLLPVQTPESVLEHSQRTPPPSRSLASQAAVASTTAVVKAITALRYSMKVHRVAMQVCSGLNVLARPSHRLGRGSGFSLLDGLEDEDEDEEEEKGEEEGLVRRSTKSALSLPHQDSTRRRSGKHPPPPPSQNETRKRSRDQRRGSVRSAEEEERGHFSTVSSRGSGDSRTRQWRPPTNASHRTSKEAERRKSEHEGVDWPVETPSLSLSSSFSSSSSSFSDFSFGTEEVEGDGTTTRCTEDLMSWTSVCSAESPEKEREMELESLRQSVQHVLAWSDAVSLTGGCCPSPPFPSASLPAPSAGDRVEDAGSGTSRETFIDALALVLGHLHYTRQKCEKALAMATQSIQTLTRHTATAASAAAQAVQAATTAMDPSAGVAGASRGVSPRGTSHSLPRTEPRHAPHPSPSSVTPPPYPWAALAISEHRLQDEWAQMAKDRLEAVTRHVMVVEELWKSVKVAFYTGPEEEMGEEGRWPLFLHEVGLPKPKNTEKEDGEKMEEGEENKSGGLPCRTTVSIPSRTPHTSREGRKKPSVEVMELLQSIFTQAVQRHEASCEEWQ